MGFELIRKLEEEGVKVFGFIILFVIKVDGMKFGKMEGGVIWFDKEKILLYEFY